MDDKTISFVSVLYIRIDALRLRIMKINILVLYKCHKEFERYIADTNVKRTMFLWRLIKQSVWEYHVYVTVGFHTKEVLVLTDLVCTIWNLWCFVVLFWTSNDSDAWNIGYSYNKVKSNSYLQVSFYNSRQFWKVDYSFHIDGFFWSTKCLFYPIII